MITYEHIYETRNKERDTKNMLQKLPAKFLTDFSQYLQEKKNLSMQGSDDEFSEIALKTKKQIENARTLFKELMVLRRKKILNLVLVASETGITRQDFEFMLPFERELFESIMRSVEQSDRQLIEALQGAGESSVLNHDLVTFLEPVSSFVGLSGESLGPFEKGQIANLPKDVAKILIESGKCELIVSS